jgi:hypothetical protein
LWKGGSTVNTRRDEKIEKKEIIFMEKKKRKRVEAKSKAQ